MMAAKKSTVRETAIAVEETTVETTKEKIKESSFTKSQILKSKKYKSKVDILNTILGERKYTLSEVDNLLAEFLNREVK